MGFHLFSGNSPLHSHQQFIPTFSDAPISVKNLHLECPCGEPLGLALENTVTVGY